MFDFGRANEAQREAIQTVDGPLLIIAGPGTGKTFTLVQRALYMIREKGIKPEQIMLATFTEKAAKELVTRISNELARLGESVNINDMYIGTFHAICYRLIEEYQEKTHVGRNYHSLDSFEQQYMVFRDLISGKSSFNQIEGLFRVVKTQRWNAKTRKRDGRKISKWDQAGQICQIVNELTEELVAPETLIGDAHEYSSVVGRIQTCYAEMIAQKNSLDFSGCQAEVYRLLKENPDVLAEMREKIRYIMVDEYQDTNYIQEQIVFLLAGEEKNICVVGDDDQGLYRFRGATVRNILQFPEKFEAGACKTVALTVNYRSNPDIIDFYNRWMSTTVDGFQWGPYRHPKVITAGKTAGTPSPAVVKIAAERTEEAWKQANLDFVNMLLQSGKVTDLNQIAFLFRSVKAPRIRALAEHFERHGIRVYSPRSDLFFEREEIKLLLGCLLLCFPNLAAQLEKGGFPQQNETLREYYGSCLVTAREYLLLPEGAPLKSFVDDTGKAHASLRQTTDYNFTGLVYRMFAFEPFQSMLSQELGSDVVALRPARNLSKLVSCLGKYENLYQIDRLKPGRIDRDAFYLFTMYMDCLEKGGITEYEDQSEYAPSGCVSFLTIHQSKGMEFPVVVVGSLDIEPEKKLQTSFDRIRNTYYLQEPFEPFDSTEAFDFLRLYYTAFSRAQNLLVLTAKTYKFGKSQEPSRWFEGCFNALPDWKDERFHVDEFCFDPVKDTNLKESYSFTSHIAVYEECPRKYKFVKELGFMPARINATVFGTLIHQTIEDMHRAAVQGEAHRITEDAIRAWLSKNYDTLSQSEHIVLSPAQRKAALRQTLCYARRQEGQWDKIRASEVELSSVKPDYILKGTIDLIRGEGDTVEIVDFKSDKKPDPDKNPGRLERYKKQLQLYARLVEEQKKLSVSRMHLYYTGDESGAPTITFENDRAAVDTMINEFDTIVRKIMAKDFAARAADRASCDSCDFKYYCDSADRRKPLVRGFAFTDSEVMWAKETARRKYDPRNARQKLKDIFLDDLAKNLVKTWLSGENGLSIAEYDQLRKDPFTNADNYDLVVNGFQVEVKAYLDKKLNCPGQELLSKRRLFVRDKAPDMLVQVIFVSQKTLADYTDVDTLASELCKNGFAYIVGWVTAEEQAAAVRAGKKELPLSETHDMPELVELLQKNKGQIRLCDRCGSIKVQRTNRSTGEKFWGCPNYRLHK